MLLEKTGPVSEHVEVLATPQLPVFLVKGKDWALVEGAMSMVAPALFEQLHKMDRAAQKLKYLILSHSHFDHVGAVTAIKRAFPDIEVLGSEATREVFNKPNAVAYIKSLNNALSKGAMNKDNPMSHVDLTIGDNIPFDRVVTDGEVIELGDGVSITVHEVPGHSRCSIALFLEPDKAIFTGESAGFYNEPGKIISEGLSDYGAYIKSLEKMRDLKPEVICLPHNGVIVEDEANEYFDLAIKSGVEFKGVVEGLLSGGKEVEGIVDELTGKEYKGKITIQPKDIFKGNLRAMVKSIKRQMEAA